MKCAFFQHWHAYKTGSTNHFKELLENLGLEVQVFDRDKFVFDEITSFDIIVLYQADHLIATLSQSGMPILVVPMFDETLDRKADFFRHELEYVSFSRTLHHFLKWNGNHTQYLQYWPDISAPPILKSKEVFFWERTPIHVSVKNVINWFKTSDYKIKIRQHWDPTHKGEKLIKYENKIEILDDTWLSHEQFYSILKKSQIFIAPRRWEGIGVSTLEAMTFGNAVVGLDSPTLNEYVIHKQTGFLIKQSKKDEVLPNLNWERIGLNALEVAEEGRSKYKVEAPNIVGRALERALDKRSRNRRSLLPKKLKVRKFVYLKDFQR
jgi:glycosyltransferase involved in cell wall biosynthesis